MSNARFLCGRPIQFPFNQQTWLTAQVLLMQCNAAQRHCRETRRIHNIKCPQRTRFVDNDVTQEYFARTNQDKTGNARATKQWGAFGHHCCSEKNKKIHSPPYPVIKMLNIQRKSELYVKIRDHLRTSRHIKKWGVLAAHGSHIWKHQTV